MISVIIPSKDRLIILRGCIENVIRAFKGFDFEIIVV
ncbi:MAG: glycosyltransferase involved in cell wall biosynthesis, partial [Salibacteraceae bacterium]